METVGVASYRGIFKFVKSEKAKAPFLKARVLISEKKFKEAVEEFSKSIELCDSQDDVETVQLVINEIKRYVKYQIDSTLKPAAGIEWETLDKRGLEMMEERLDQLPQGVFLVKLKLADGKSVTLLGRKTLSCLWLKNLIPELFCSQIRADMLLGVLSDWRVTDSKLVAFYHPITAFEKVTIFNQIVLTSGKDMDIVYPFPLINPLTRKELTSPEEGWDVDESFDHALSSGEVHIRQVTVDILQQYGFTSHVLYDPACSTGVFLNSLKQAFPECTTIGQDLSQKMCNVAKSRVDQVHCGSAIDPKIELGSAHCAFIRFLNSEVVTSEEAELLLKSLLPTVAVGGIIVTFGHTPVLLSSSNFRLLKGFEILSNVSVSKDKSSVFQYYIIRRTS